MCASESPRNRGVTRKSLYENILSKNPLFVKGYHVDRQKVGKMFEYRADDPDYCRTVGLIDLFPLPYEYLSLAIGPDGVVRLVAVMADDYDPKKLETKEILEINDALNQYFTGGIWPRF
ncbi:hypothetical protein JAAARDRAFT_76103 [Jaapia argillacea MUCL 33604]|uniref:Uncharacterized protein n=1 Tax=Jaapia argillacea MUCL 33604 TaxID=933084 RepID=A0A067Q4U9_9AGAM|nr:hypothetical protein JAAARDRAFT_76103 [Jaapia argillacea MUCL 33604]